MNSVYLDHNATTPVEPAVVDAMLPYLSDEYGNASSIHTFGQKARAAVETAREQIAELIGAHPQEIIFTSGGTEADNHAIVGVANRLVSWPSQRSATPSDDIKSRLYIAPLGRVITTVIEHEAVLNTCQALEKAGVPVTYLAVDREGCVDPESVRQALRADSFEREQQSGGSRSISRDDLRSEPVLVTIMHANNELGTVQPLDEIGRITAEADAYFHTDAVQSAGKIPIDVESLRVDLLSLSGHKLYAPKGIGALYVRSGTPLQQLVYGGHHQRGFRPGTENVPGIVGFGKAAEIARKSLSEDSARMSALRDKLEQGLLERVRDARVNGSRAPRTANTTNITFSGIEGEALVIALDLKGLACSTGAACSSGAVEPSHVLTAIGLPPDEARATLRFSLGRHTTATDVDFALRVVPAAVAQLRELSPTYRREASARP